MVVTGRGGRGPSGGRAASCSSRTAASSGGVVRPRTGTQGPGGWTRGKQQQSQPPAFSTRSRNDTRGKLEVARSKSLRCRWGSQLWMHQRVLRRPNKQGQRLSAGFRYLMMIRPRSVEVRLRRHREVPWGPKRWGKHGLRGVPGGRRVRRLLVALKWMELQACVRGRLKWNLISLIIRWASWFLGVKT